MITIRPNLITGKIRIPPSKSASHRAIICACLAEKESHLVNLQLSDDIMSTIDAMRALGAQIECIKDIDNDNYVKLTIIPIDINSINSDKVIIDCNESGSTLRFLIPIAIELFDEVTFHGKGKLPTRPLDVYFDIFDENGIDYDFKQEYLPLNIKGKFSKNSFNIKGDISSQFITGLLLWAPLTDKDIAINITTKLESKKYVDITLDIMSSFGIAVDFNEAQNRYNISGSSKYQSCDYHVEGDWSQAAFFLLMGVKSYIEISGLNRNSKQGDMEIINILNKMGANIYWKDDILISNGGTLNGIDVDVSQCPDLAPVIAAAMSAAVGESTITGGERLILKESNRIKAVADTLNKLGANVAPTDDGMIIEGVKVLKGNEVSCYNDHRIAMMIGAVSQFCEGDIIVHGEGCVNKSYPNFWEDFKNIGGRI